VSRNIVILGSTGSIGVNTLSVVRHLGDRIRVVGVAAGTNVDRLSDQARTFNVDWAAIADADRLSQLRTGLPTGCRGFSDQTELCERVAGSDVDIVLCAIVGTTGLGPVLAAVRAGKTIALASKEVLVMAGELVMTEARRCGARIIPVDSEHSAIFQCLEGHPTDHVRRLILTASGGPFRDTPADQLQAVTCAEALAHPTWNMGSKISIDSATLMNKGLEIIEARWLFGVTPEQIEVVIHPQSIIHSMVEYVDGSTLAQLGYPDMRVPIQYALTWPDRCSGITRFLDLTETLSLQFEPPDNNRFPALALARRALATGGTLPAVFNAANEIAVAAFLRNNLSFPGIWQTAADVMDRHTPCLQPDLDAILTADAWAREQAAESVQ